MFKNLPTVAKPEWMNKAIFDVQNNLTVLQRGLVPDKLQGKVLQISALRLLRIVFGSDEESVEALAEFVAEKRIEEAVMQAEIDKRVDGGMSPIEALDQMCRELERQVGE